MTAYTNKPEQITALYARLSQEDTLDGDSIVNQDEICQGVFLLNNTQKHPLMFFSQNNLLFVRTVFQNISRLAIEHITDSCQC